VCQIVKSVSSLVSCFGAKCIVVKHLAAFFIVNYHVSGLDFVRFF
jgi:hypothetical protein